MYIKCAQNDNENTDKSLSECNETRTHNHWPIQNIQSLITVTNFTISLNLEYFQEIYLAL